MTPAWPLPSVEPDTSTFIPGWNMSTFSSEPTFSSAIASGETRNSRIWLPASTPALEKWPAIALVTRVARRLPKATWTAT